MEITKYMRKVLFLATCIVNTVLVLTIGIIILLFSSEQNENTRVLLGQVYQPIDELTLRKVKVIEMQVFINEILFVDPYQVTDINIRFWETEKSRQNLFDLLGRLAIDGEDAEIIAEMKKDYEMLMGLYDKAEEILRKRNRVDAKEYAARIAHIQGNLFRLIDLKIEKCKELGAAVLNRTEERGRALLVIVLVVCGMIAAFNAAVTVLNIVRKK